MALIFQDFFTEASVDTNLENHTPDVGTGWTVEEQTVTPRHLRAKFSSDRCQADVDGGSRRSLYTAQPDPVAAEYDIEFVIAIMPTTGTDDPIGMIARFTDTSNYYSSYYRNDSVDKNRIYKKVAGTITELASTNSEIANSDELKFEIRNATKKIFKQGVELASTTDNVLASSGKAGLAIGDYAIEGDDILTTFELDNFRTTETTAPSAGTELFEIAHHMRGGFNSMHGGFSA